MPSYTQTIADTFSLGQMILQVTATDADNDIVKYEITGGSRALEFYYINPDTGAISLKKPLTEGTQSQDSVSFLRLYVSPSVGYIRPGFGSFPSVDMSVICLWTLFLVSLFCMTSKLKTWMLLPMTQRYTVYYTELKVISPNSRSQGNGMLKYVWSSAEM